MMRSLGLLLACGLGLLNGFTPAGEKIKPTEQTANEIKIFEMTNEERKKKNVSQLVLSASLSKIARAHSENMAKQMKFDHKLDEKTPFDRMRDAGYKYQNAGENIAQGDENANLDLIMKSWMDSKNHRANILHADYTEIGIGIARDKMGQIYYTQVFGRPFAK
jgi:uncharacterized protein YkwD